MRKQSRVQTVKKDLEPYFYTAISNLIIEYWQTPLFDGTQLTKLKIGSRRSRPCLSFAYETKLYVFDQNQD